MRRIDAGDGAILEMGYSTCRVRVHGDMARIELPLQETARAVVEPVRSQIQAALVAVGFRYVTLDLQGCRMGSPNVF